MIFALTLATFVLTLVLIALVLKGNRIMATTQAELEAYIENTLTPALTSLEATGAQVAAAVNALVAAYQAGAADLTPQLTELQGLASRLTADAAQGTTLAAQITADVPAAPAPAPTTPTTPATPTTP